MTITSDIARFSVPTMKPNDRQAFTALRVKAVPDNYFGWVFVGSVLRLRAKGS